MNQTKLDRLFTMVQQGTKRFKTREPEGDGRAFWQPMKQLFGKQNIQASCWKQIDSTLVEKLINLEEFDESGNMIPLNHFLRQQVRIPTQEEPSLRRIMQVALNSGQFMASGAKCDFYNSLKDFDYYQSGLYRLRTYMLEDDVEKINSLISESLIEKIEIYLSKQVGV